MIWFYQVQIHMADFRFILVAFGVVWFGLVWFGCSILIWFGGSPVLPAPLGSTLPPTASTILPTTDHGRTRKKEKKTEWDIELLRN